MTSKVNENGVMIHCNNVECSEIIDYQEHYYLPDYCSWSCKAIEKEREK